MFIRYNGNPCGKENGDCVIRAISIATGKEWFQVYAGLCVQGRFMCGWGNFNDVWSAYLEYLGFERYELPDNYTYSVSDFATEHPRGIYVLGTGNHAVAVVNGDVIDSWDSSGEIPKYYFRKRG